MSDAERASMEETISKKRPIKGPMYRKVKRRILNSNKTSISTAESDFLIQFNNFMQEHQIPIDRLPTLGFKEVDLYSFYRGVQNLGGYEEVTHRKLWKRVYCELGSNPSSTSAATCARRHYERLLLPYERHVRSEKYGQSKSGPGPGTGQRQQDTTLPMIILETLTPPSPSPSLERPKDSVPSQNVPLNIQKFTTANGSLTVTASTASVRSPGENSSLIELAKTVSSQPVTSPIGSPTQDGLTSQPFSPGSTKDTTAQTAAAPNSSPKLSPPSSVSSLGKPSSETVRYPLQSAKPSVLSPESSPSPHVVSPPLFPVLNIASPKPPQCSTLSSFKSSPSPEFPSDTSLGLLQSSQVVSPSLAASLSHPLKIPTPKSALTQQFIRRPSTTPPSPGIQSVVQVKAPVSHVPSTEVERSRNHSSNLYHSGQGPSRESSGIGGNISKIGKHLVRSNPPPLLKISSFKRLPSAYQHNVTGTLTKSLQRQDQKVDINGNYFHSEQVNKNGVVRQPMNNQMQKISQIVKDHHPLQAPQVPKINKQMDLQPIQLSPSPSGRSQPGGTISVHQQMRTVETCRNNVMFSSTEPLQNPPFVVSNTCPSGPVGPELNDHLAQVYKSASKQPPPVTLSQSCSTKQVNKGAKEDNESIIFIMSGNKVYEVKSEEENLPVTAASKVVVNHPVTWDLVNNGPDGSQISCQCTHNNDVTCQDDPNEMTPHEKHNPLSPNGTPPNVEIYNREIDTNNMFYDPAQQSMLLETQAAKKKTVDMIRRLEELARTYDQQIKDLSHEAISVCSPEDLNTDLKNHSPTQPKSPNMMTTFEGLSVLHHGCCSDCQEENEKTEEVVDLRKMPQGLVTSPDVSISPVVFRSQLSRDDTQYEQGYKSIFQKLAPTVSYSTKSTSPVVVNHDRVEVKTEVVDNGVTMSDGPMNLVTHTRGSKCSCGTPEALN